MFKKKLIRYLVNNHYQSKYESLVGNSFNCPHLSPFIFHHFKILTDPLKGFLNHLLTHHHHLHFF